MNSKCMVTSQNNIKSNIHCSIACTTYFNDIKVFSKYVYNSSSLVPKIKHFIFTVDMSVILIYWNFFLTPMVLYQ